MKASRIVPYLVLGIVAISFFYWSSWKARMYQEGDRIRAAQTAAALKQADAWRGRLVAAQKHNDELGTELAAAHATIAQTMAEADSIAAIIDGIVPDSRTIIPDMDTTRWKVAYQLRTAEVRRVRAALMASDSARAILTAQVSLWRTTALEADTLVAQLQVALRGERDARQCRILGILPCPSRTTALVLGAAGGLVLGVALTR